MSHVILRCNRCDASDGAAPAALACGSCGAPLDAADSAPVVRGRARPASMEGLPGIWSLWERLPLHQVGNIVSLGEGNTPCVPLDRVGSRLGLERLYAKLEYLNPTGSFKDRGTSAMLSMVRELGFQEVVEDSSGNAGASLAAYAARGGIRAIVYVPATASPYKMAQIRFYGAELRPIDGDREAVAGAAREYMEATGSFYASHNWSAYFIEGMKSFAYEAVQQLDVPIEHMVFPVGNGSLLLGAWKGFVELREQDRVIRIPRLHCAQARACMPIVAAWQGQEWTASQLGTTVAGGIAVSNPPRGHQVAQALKATEGVATAVEEEQILHWQRVLAREEGLFIEPTSAAAFAGLEALVRQQVIRPREVTLVPVTGFGLKDPVPAP